MNILEAKLNLIEIKLDQVDSRNPQTKQHLEVKRLLNKEKEILLNLLESKTDREECIHHSQQLSHFNLYKNEKGFIG